MSDPSKSVWLTVSEFTYVSVATFIIPNPLTVGLPIFEFPNICRTIWMCPHSGSVWLAIYKRPNIYRTVCKSIGTSPLRYALLGFTNVSHKPFGLTEDVWEFADPLGVLPSAPENILADCVETQLVLFGGMTLTMWSRKILFWSVSADQTDKAVNSSNRRLSRLFEIMYACDVCFSK